MHNHRVFTVEDFDVSPNQNFWFLVNVSASKIVEHSLELMADLTLVSTVASELGVRMIKTRIHIFK